MPWCEARRGREEGGRRGDEKADDRDDLAAAAGYEAVLARL